MTIWRELPTAASYPGAEDPDGTTGGCAPATPARYGRHPPPASPDGPSTGHPGQASHGFSRPSRGETSKMQELVTTPTPQPTAGKGPGAHRDNSPRPVTPQTPGRGAARGPQKPTSMSPDRALPRYTRLSPSDARRCHLGNHPNTRPKARTTDPRNTQIHGHRKTLPTTKVPPIR